MTCSWQIDSASWFFWVRRILKMFARLAVASLRARFRSNTLLALAIAAIFLALLLVQATLHYQAEQSLRQFNLLPLPT